MPQVIVLEELVPADQSDAYEYRDRATLHASPWVDGAGNQFDCFSTLAGNTTAVIVVKSDPTGRELQRWSLPARAPFKLDDFGVFQAGPDLIFLIAGHEISSDPARRNIVYRDILPGVAVPYAHGVMPVGAATRYVESEPTVETIDYGRIAREVSNELQARMNGDLGNQVQQRAKNGARQGIQAEGVLTESTVHASTGLYTRLKETVYEVLLENGLIHPKG